MKNMKRVLTSLGIVLSLAATTAATAQSNDQGQQTYTGVAGERLVLLGQDLIKAEVAVRTARGDCRAAGKLLDKSIPKAKRSAAYQECLTMKRNGQNPTPNQFFPDTANNNGGSNLSGNQD